MLLCHHWTCIGITRSLQQLDVVSLHQNCVYQNNTNSALLDVTAMSLWSFISQSIAFTISAQTYHKYSIYCCIPFSQTTAGSKNVHWWIEPLTKNIHIAFHLVWTHSSFHCVCAGSFHTVIRSRPQTLVHEFFSNYSIRISICNVSCDAGFLHGNTVHNCVCSSCSGRMRVGQPCPMCRAPIERIITRVYQWEAFNQCAPK